MKPHAAANPRPDRREQDAFTFTDLLVVLGIVAVLALLSLTALAHNQPSSDRAGCANNLRRLMQAWQMYADDNAGRLMANYGTGAWVSGWLDYTPSNSDNTNTIKLTNATYAAIGPYVNSSLLFRCPADGSSGHTAGVSVPRVRSYSMNDHTGLPSPPQWDAYQVMVKLSEISQPTRVFVLIDEQPDSINDSRFYMDCQSTGAATRVFDLPGYSHLGGANLGMADGHLEYWQWMDARTMPPILGSTTPAILYTPNNPDVARLQAGTSYPK